MYDSLISTENLISFAISIWMCICMWFIFEKAWEKWWKAIIPIWDLYILCKIINKRSWFWVFLSVPIIWLIWILFSALSLVLSWTWIDITVFFQLFNWILWLLTLIFSIFTLCYAIASQVYLWKVFWKWAWFCVWMVFLSFIFWWILAFDDSKYDVKNLEKKKD